MILLQYDTRLLRISQGNAIQGAMLPSFHTRLHPIPEHLPEQPGHQLIKCLRLALHQDLILPKLPGEQEHAVQTGVCLVPVGNSGAKLLLDLIGKGNHTSPPYARSL